MSTIKKITNEAKKQTFKNLIYSLNATSNNNISVLLSGMELITPKEHKATLRQIKESVKKDTGFIKFLRRVLNDSNKNFRDKFFLNLIAQGFLIDQELRNKVKKTGSYPPTTVLVSPTMRCNLSCVGCYAANYSKKDDMDYETFDRIITEAREMGVSFFTILGGETLFYPHLFKIFERHKDAFFQFYTNGTLMNKKIVDRLAKVGNAIPMISIEGWEKQTDERRGKGTYQKIMKAMDLLNTQKIPFGISVAVTSKNSDIVSGDEFMDLMVKKGAYFSWWFLYMPIGRKPDIKLMPTPSQREMLHEKGRHIRNKYPVFLIDFWNDAPYVGGCIAGREYIHITSKGDVEPCIFTHFASDNIKDKSLSDVMKSDYFKELRKRQPYNDNLYMPCMWIDNPEVSREIHNKCKVYSTHPDADCMIVDKKTKAHLDKYAKEIDKRYKKIWNKDKAFFCQHCQIKDK